MDKIREKAGPIFYIVVCILGVAWFYWFATLYH